jgi:hypothetical protein
MWMAIVWPALLVLIYALLFGFVLFLAHRFTRGFENEASAGETPVVEPGPIGATHQPTA